MELYKLQWNPATCFINKAKAKGVKAHTTANVMANFYKASKLQTTK